jgi:Predicted membrane protein
MIDLLIGLVLSIGVSVVAYQRERLDQRGAVAAVIIGTIIYVTGGWLYTAMMLFFFVSANVVSHWSEVVKPKRTVIQVLANGLVATLLSIGYYLSGDSVYTLLYAASIAVATADTWASEIGLLSRTSPRHILTMKPVLPGTDGGVSPLGMTASVIAAGSVSLFVGASWIVLQQASQGALLTRSLESFNEKK